MIKYEPCSYIQEAILDSKIENDDGSYTYRFKIPTLIPMPTGTGYIINKTRLANTESNLIQISRTTIADSDLITLNYNEDVYGKIYPGNKILIVFIGGDPTRIRILGR